MDVIRDCAGEVCDSNKENGVTGWIDMHQRAWKGFIFDFDYTLGDSTKGIVLCIRYALEQMGYPVPDVEMIRRTIGLSLADTFYALTDSSDVKKAHCFSKYFKEMADKVMVENTIIYPEAIKLLRTLKEKAYQVGIVTTKYHYRIEQILAKYELQDFVDEIIGAEDVSVEKPDPEGLLLMLQRLQLAQSEVLYVGDSLVDAKTAKRASVAFAGVLTGTTTAQEFMDYAPFVILPNLMLES